MSLIGGIANQFIKQLAEGDQIRDYQHATRMFVDGLYRLSPKLQSLFHVFVDLNTVVANTDQQSQVEIGMLAKSVALPRFTITNKIYNAYNRKNLVQDKINYDPLTITFHDDSADVVRKFWYGYYSYYYRDADHNEAMYNQDHKYKQRQSMEWGFTPKSQTAPGYINSIRIYSLHQKQFSAYTLIRPMIQSFQHGQHTTGEYAPLEHTMTVAYEAVQYTSGRVSNGTVLGFSGIHYDRTPSPLTSIGGGTTSILGPGGLVEGANDAITNLQNGNFGAAALGALRTGNNFKNADLKAVAAGELAQLGQSILKGQNTQSTVFFPTAASVTQGLSVANNPVPSLGQSTSRNMNAAGSQILSSNQGRIDL
jgi:hypothetical protein